MPLLDLSFPRRLKSLRNGRKRFVLIDPRLRIHLQMRLATMLVAVKYLFRPVSSLADVRATSLIGADPFISPADGPICQAGERAETGSEEKQNACDRAQYGPFPAFAAAKGIGVGVQADIGSRKEDRNRPGPLAQADPEGARNQNDLIDQ